MQTNEEIKAIEAAAREEFLSFLQTTGLVARIMKVNNGVVSFEYKFTPLFERLVLPHLKFGYPQSKDWDEMIREIESRCYTNRNP